MVPVFNSVDTLSPLVERLEHTLVLLDREFEVLLVNDGSRDQSWDVIHRLVQEHPFVRGINLMRTYGQHNPPILLTIILLYQVLTIL